MRDLCAVLIGDRGYPCHEKSHGEEADGIYEKCSAENKPDGAGHCQDYGGLDDDFAASQSVGDCGNDDASQDAANEEQPREKNALIRCERFFLAQTVDEREYAIDDSAAQEQCKGQEVDAAILQDGFQAVQNQSAELLPPVGLPEWAVLRARKGGTGRPSRRLRYRRSSAFRQSRARRPVWVRVSRQGLCRRRARETRYP